MFRLALIALGGLAGYRLAKMGRSRMNFVAATLSAALVYKLTRARMKTTGEIAENGVDYNNDEPRFREVDAEII